MSQRITITIDGKDGIVLPDVALKILEHVFLTLQSIDENSWAAGGHRLRWSVTGASKSSPFTVTYGGEVVRPEFANMQVPDIADLFINGYEEIEKEGTSPKYFSAEDIKRVAEVARAAKHLDALKFQNGRASHSIRPSVLIDRATGILENPDILDSHGSLEGTLVSLQNYPDKPGAHATLLTRIRDYRVSCALSPLQAEDLNDYVDRKTRVVLYGKITYESRVPKSIKVERHNIIPPDDKLPTLEDVRALHLTIPEGTTIEDYLSEMNDD